MFKDGSLEFRFVVVTSADVASSKLVALREAIDSLAALAKSSKQRRTTHIQSAQLRCKFDIHWLIIARYVDEDALHSTKL